MPKWVLILLIGFCGTVYGQKQNNIWVFGNKSGINFNNSPATSYDFSALKVKFPYYTSSICDKQGRLLFYTNGDTIWNREHYKLLNYQPYWPWKEYTIPLLLPYINNDSLFYLFGASELLNAFGYVTLDLRGDQGRGEIANSGASTRDEYYTELLPNCSLFMAATDHCNGRDKWVVSHKQHALYAFKVSDTGVSKVPVVSEIDSLIIATGNHVAGNIKFSASGEKLVMPLLNKNKIAVFDFNNSTGKFSNTIVLDIQPNFTFTEVEISPDGSKVYYSAFEVDPESGMELHQIFQLDLNLMTKAAIENSRVNLSPAPDKSGCSPRRCWWVFRTMQQGPDGRIYVSLNDQMSFTSVIEEPNEAGIAATYNVDNLNVKKVYNTINYNYNRSASYTPKENGIQVKKSNCTDQPVQFSLLYNKVDLVEWDFGDLDAGVRNYSNLKNPRHTYPAPGNYLVKAIIHHPCFTETATVQVNISKNEPVRIPTRVADTVICIGKDFLADVTTPFAQIYMWNDGTATPTRIINKAGTYEVRAQNDCSLDVRKFTVSYEKCGCEVFTPNAFTPNSDGLNDSFRPIFYCNPKNYSFRVYSRLGNIVFSTNQLNKGWDGSMNSKLAGSGTYVWIMEYLNPETKKVIREKGTVTLIR